MKNYTKKYLKASNGITLIALVITIIVLLILAGISISMLSGDNSILQKATDAKTNTDNAQIQERINLAYHSALVDGQGELTEPSLEKELKNEFNKSTLDEGWIDKTSVTGKWKITIDGISLLVPAGVANETPSIINYGSKTAETVEVGDDITIDTEKFKVLKKSSDGKTITAIPYYNLVLNSDPIIQATADNAGTSVGNAGTIAFSSAESSNYEANKDIDLDNNVNNVNNYIKAYETTLKNLGANNVTTRIARYQEMYDLTSSEAPSTLRNPSGVGLFWLGTSSPSGGVRIIIPIGAFTASSPDRDDNYGVRPLIVISL